MYILLGLSIVLAALLVFNSLASLFATLSWRLLGKRANWFSAASCASIVFLLRTFPVALGISCVGLLLAPAYIAHEPVASHEGISAKLAIIAFASAIGLIFALLRGVATWRATSRLKSDWLANAAPIKLPQVGIPAYRIQHPFPVIAVVGVLRPRLFIADQIFNSLAPAELMAAILHETGHVMAHDNLRRGLMRACRDVLLMIPCGRLLDRAWVEASEAAADEYAAARGGKVALDLASALVKIARLVPVGVRPAMPAGAFLIGADEAGGIKTRVRRLMQLANEKHERHRKTQFAKMPIWLPLALTITIVAFTANKPQVLASVHSLIEDAVYILK
jgi:Zn-dependent protease with chaperone function